MKTFSKKTKKEPFVVIGAIDEPLWYKLKCVCAQDPNDVVNRFPVKNCLFCKFTEQEKSIPKEPFEIKNIKGNIQKINKIKLVRGPKYEDVMGWIF
tara:strand:- start:879 stop:1166 length:288 start_codon:yes stop_codon:yes gene_type:complete